MIDGAWGVLLGLALGLQHATDADHVVAVATIVTRTRRLAAGALIGACWGLGHSVTVLAVGLPIVLAGLTLPARLVLGFEVAVAGLLVGLGGWRIWRALRDGDPVPAGHLAEPHGHEPGPAFHSHLHAHEGLVHRHPHVHPSARLARVLAGVGAGRALGSLAVGVVHGLAGSAAVALLVVPAMPGRAGGVLYLLGFGGGTIAGMTLMTAGLALALAARPLAAPRWRRALGAGAGSLSLGLGAYLWLLRL